ncbi:hypothetical protein [Natronococcus sp. A-GB7]|uniref:hypothetical protein n=1 Tax=Natronococcus sp. A-GB7 TaxID=3037649 RepID=UPI00241F38A8|nr:hypothetical protein [Natronococcus sp. A-GB7]MDG5821544.1 hypothetical protein [Natronococcus sp. A-GB7]
MSTSVVTKEQPPERGVVVDGVPRLHDVVEREVFGLADSTGGLHPATLEFVVLVDGTLAERCTTPDADVVFPWSLSITAMADGGREVVDVGVVRFRLRKVKGQARPFRTGRM